MKALSVKQPWAHLIAIGRKTAEIRSRRTHLRGELLICATQSPDKDAILDLRNRGFELPDDLQTGVAVCIVKVIGCEPMTEAHAAAACCAVESNCFAWLLGDVRRLTPFPVSGRQTIFNVEPPPT